MLLTLLVTLIGGGPRAFAAPGNDQFVNAAVVHTLPFGKTVDITEATLEPSEPTDCVGPQRTIWYRFTPSEAEGVVAHADLDSVVGVYSGSSIDNLKPISCTVASQMPLFAVDAGTTYYLQVGSTSCCDAQSVTFSFEVAPLADLAVTSLSVTNVPFQTDAGDVPSGYKRRIHVTVTNLGPDSSGRYTDLQVDVCPKQYPQCANPIYFEGGLNMGNGVSLRREIAWEALFKAGDFVVRAVINYPRSCCYTSADPDTDNNFAETDSYVLLGRTGQGIDGCIYPLWPRICT